MKKSRKQVAEGIKAKILLELFAPGCVVSQLAKSYDVSESVLYKWRRAGGLFGANHLSQALLNESKFIELSVHQDSSPSSEKTTDAANLQSNLQATKLQKVSLTYENLSLSVEGYISSTNLFAILQILEGRC